MMIIRMYLVPGVRLDEVGEARRLLDQVAVLPRRFNGEVVGVRVVVDQDSSAPFHRLGLPALTGLSFHNACCLIDHVVGQSHRLGPNSCHGGHSCLHRSTQDVLARRYIVHELDRGLDGGLYSWSIELIVCFGEGCGPATLRAPEAAASTAPIPAPMTLFTKGTGAVMASTGLATASTAASLTCVAVEWKEKVGVFTPPPTVEPLQASTECAALPSDFTTFSPEAILSTAQS